MAAFLFDEKAIVNDNILKYEERLNSQYTRFLDKTPTYTMYYNISTIESTVDNGLGNYERDLGENGSTRYNEIHDFPIYGIDQVILAISSDDSGLDTDYQGDGVILPNTIVPLPGDYFTIKHLDSSYVFQVNEVAFDTIKSNNFYKISFNIKAVDGNVAELLEKQASDRFDCIFTNIGTKEKCLVRKDEVALLVKLNTIYSRLAERFKIFFYDVKYNVFVFRNDEELKMYGGRRMQDKTYDRFLCYFANKHKLFQEQNRFDTFYLTEERIDYYFDREYYESIYKAIEEQDKSYLIRNYMYTSMIHDVNSIFSMNRDKFTRDVSLSEAGSEFYVPEALIQSINDGLVNDTDPITWRALQQFFAGKIDSIHTLDMQQIENAHRYMTYNRETFVMIPLFLYVLKTMYQKFMAVE